ncbi:hypothetical protein ACN9PN_09500 [Klebsiella pasteurii]|uniref:hypothetical protein n=1 Tax=Klebsiella pasteurii TaxID=2587529 RepID=UPI00244BFFF1|nr:hypothetical protein [Klebsiella pasteurii]MDH0313279.1 hypothetical protein [Klebsiella pasteurii]
MIKEKNETMKFAVGVVLQSYCNSIYYMADEYYDTAVFFAQNKEAADYLLYDLIKDLTDDFDYYKKLYGTGYEKQEHIDFSELKRKVLLLYEQNVKYFVMKNLKAASKEVKMIMTTGGVNDLF